MNGRPRRISPGKLAAMRARLAEAEAAGRRLSIAKLAAEFDFDEQTTRRALARSGWAPRNPDPIRRSVPHCPAAVRAALQAAAASRGTSPGKLVAAILLNVLAGNLVNAVLDDAA